MFWIDETPQVEFQGGIAFLAFGGQRFAMRPGCLRNFVEIGRRAADKFDREARGADPVAFRKRKRG